jgi:hypothetical protein
MLRKLSLVPHIVHLAERVQLNHTHKKKSSSLTSISKDQIVALSVNILHILLQYPFLWDAHLCCLKTMGTNYPVMQYHSSEDQIPHLHHYENLKIWI